MAAAWPPPCAAAQDAATSNVRALPMSATLGFESLRLPGREPLGLVGGSLLFEIADDWWSGPAAYGAATGERGGFFVGGFEAQRRWRLVEHLHLSAGLFVGGGGGGAAPVGGGLMLRPALALTRDFGGYRAGISWSDVRFPNGKIRSSQLGLVFGWQGEYRYAAPTSTPRTDAVSASGLGLAEFSGTLGEYRLKGVNERRIGLIGARAEWRQAGSGAHWGIESAAAAKGDAAGYMEVLGSVGWEYAAAPLNDSLSVGVRGALGLGGGGAMPSGGGLIAKAAATLAWEFQPGWRIGLEAGWLDGLHRRLQAQTLQAWLAMNLEPRRAAGDASPAEPLIRNEWSVGLQHVQHVPRNDGSRGPVELLGGKFNHAVGEYVYLSAQAHSAYAGGAGAYSIGLVGAGVATPSAPGRWRCGAELLVGAAGGGGIATGGGALVQWLVWAGLPIVRDGELRLGVGAAHAPRGGSLHSPVFELSWSRAFGLSG